MTVENTENAESTENTGAEIVEQDTIEEADGNVAEAAEPEYTPNYTYRVKDEEYELPEAVRPFIKDPESEKLFRDMVERAHGLDHVKQDRTELRSQVGELSQQVQQFQNHYQTAEKFKQAGDWDSFFEFNQIPPRVLLAHARKLVHVMDPDNPQAQSQYNQQRQQHWQQIQEQERSQTLQQTLVQGREREVDMVINYRQDVQQAAQEFDQRAGRPGAFREEIRNRGQLVWQTQGRDISAEEAVNDILMFMGKAPNSPQQQQQQQNPYSPQQTAYAPSPGQYFQPGQPSQRSGYPPAAGQPPVQTPQTQPVAQARPPVIPSIEGGSSGGAPVRRPTVNSLDDIRKRQQELRQGAGR